jgi:acyl dehydratase
MKFFDDITIGAVTEFGSHTFTAEAIKRFASSYDPQRFHLDEAAAAASLFGALTASGWHTTAVMMKLIAAAGGPLPAGAIGGTQCANLGPSPGFDDLRWLRPVFAGDTLTYRATVTDKRKSRSRPDWGVVSSRFEAHNAAGEKVLDVTGHDLVERRTSGRAGLQSVGLNEDL